MPEAGYGTLLVLLAMIAFSVWIGTQAQRAVQRGSFMTGYFLGNRGLGAWALALTATVQSGGTFMGYPSLVYSTGWAGLMWISAYMVVPVAAFVVLGKRFAQLSRRTGAITVPELFCERFGSRSIGLVASLLIMAFIALTMVAQFKAGAILMKTAWPHRGALALSEDAAWQLSDQQWAALAEKLPSGLVGKLRPLVEQRFASEAALRARLAELLSAHERQSHERKIVAAASPFDWQFLVGLLIFTLTVVGYTLIGGFLASVWTDLFQSLLMAVGVAALFVLVVPGASRGGFDRPTRAAMENRPDAGPQMALGPGRIVRDGQVDEFLPLGAAFSMWIVWLFGNLSNPAGLVRLMACKDTATMRRSVVLLSFYNLLIYLPLAVICLCAHRAFPVLPEGKSDEVIPRLAIFATRDLRGGSILSGLILTAPFGAVMASVSSFLVLIASGIVRDVYQRLLRPAATDMEVRRVSAVAMLAVGVAAFLANLRPTEYLQLLIVLSSEATAASMAVPALMAAHWRRGTAAGAIAAMVVGMGVTIAPYLAHGDLQVTIWGLKPVVYGLLASALAGVSVSLLTPAPNETLIERMFGTAPPQPS